MRRPKGTGEEQRVVSVPSGRKKVGQREKSRKMRSVMVVSGGGGGGGGGGRERVVLVVDEKKRKVRRGKLTDGGEGEAVAIVIIQEFKARTGVEESKLRRRSY